MPNQQERMTNQEEMTTKEMVFPFLFVGALIVGSIGVVKFVTYYTSHLPL